MEWIKIINLAMQYIEDNLTADLSCQKVAEHSHISSFHFQRTFQNLTGMNLGEYIRNRRLSLAGQDLLSGGRKVIDIALKYGYETPESFSKAFTRFHGVSPVKARKEGTTLKSFPRLTIRISLEGGSCIDYKIINKEAFTVTAMTRSVHDEDCQTEIPVFWESYCQTEMNQKVCGAIGICIGEMKSFSEWKYGIGDFSKGTEKLPDGFEHILISASTWAIFSCTGAMPHAIQKMWNRIYTEWLPQSNYELIMDYDIECYTAGDTRQENYKSEIWIPIKEKANK